MCFGDSVDLAQEGEFSAVALEETDARGRETSSPGGAVFFRN